MIPMKLPRCQRLYGFVAEDEPMQLVTFRAEATGIMPKADIRPTDEPWSATPHRRSVTATMSSGRARLSTTKPARHTRRLLG
jgi:hypothetical protein